VAGNLEWLFTKYPLLRIPASKLDKGPASADGYAVYPVANQIAGHARNQKSNGTAKIGFSVGARERIARRLTTSFFLT
jgi:hypothetical protein